MAIHVRAVSSPWSFLSTSCSTFRRFFSSLTTWSCGKPAQLLQREYGLHWRVLPLHTMRRLRWKRLLVMRLEGFHHSLTGQLRGSKMRSAPITGWIKHSLKLENVDQHWTTDMWVTHQCTNDFLTQNLWDRKMESSISRNFETHFIKRALQINSCKEKKTWDGQVDWKNFITPQAFERVLDGHATDVFHERNPKTKSVSCWCGLRKWRQTKPKSGTSVSGFTEHKRRVVCYTGSSPRRTISIQW